MENKSNPHGHDGYYGSSSSSPTSFDHLFGPKDSSSSSSSTLFGSIFSSPSTVPGRDSSTHQSVEVKNQNTPSPSPDKGSKTNQSNKDEKSGMYEAETAEPCYLSSSIYYGGQENYSPTSSVHARSPRTLKKDDEPSTGSSSPDSASRGDWWQGSLYY